MKTKSLLHWSMLMVMTLAGFGVFTVATSQPLFTLDAAAFQQQEEQIYLEVYLLIQRSGLQFAPADSGFQAPVEVILELRTPDSLISTTPWNFLDRASTLEEITPKQKLPDIAIFPQLAPGKYVLACKVRDVNRDTTYTRSLTLDLQSISDTTLAISDIELATSLEKSAATGMFTKNGFKVIPNAEHLYGTTLPMLYYYTEIYNLKGTEGEFTVDRFILDDQGREVKKLPQKVHQKVGPSVVEVDGFSVVSLRSGSYKLKLWVEDKSAGTTATTQTRFFVFRPEDFTKKLAEEDKWIMTYDDQKLNEALDGIKFLLSDGEWRSLETLNLEGKRSFLINFWAKHDPDPSTPENEFRQTFEDRKRIADERFSYLNREGWRTDRGRVFVLFGPPDHIDNHTHDLETRPYEIWHYDSVEGGVIFAFVDHNSFGNYRLVHSTKNGEINRPNWLNEEAAVQRK